MTIYYSPDFSGNTYLGLKDNAVLFDTSVVDNMGLVGMLELRLGIHPRECSSAERLAAYYKAVNTYMKEHPDNILHRSFKLSSLETAQACLRWRDTLYLFGWDKNAPCQSDRMKALAGIEEHFDCPGFPDRVRVVTDKLDTHKDILKGDRVLLPCDPELLHPAFRHILQILSEGGTAIESLPCAKPAGNNLSRVRELLLSDSKEKITLNPEDDSFVVQHFDTELDALSYLSYKKDDTYDVWINADNKAMDNWLRMMGKPTAGSTMGQSIPQTAQLLILGMGLFYRPLNVNTLVQWLYSPVHPLEAKFRFALAETVASKGGFDNSKCRDAIKKYIDASEDQQKAQHQIESFLPDLDLKETGGMPKETLLSFTSSLKQWACGYMSVLDTKEENSLLSQQLGELSATIGTLELLLDSFDGDSVPYDTLENWTGTLYEAGSYDQYLPQAGSRFVVDSPARIAGISGKTIWCGFYNAPEVKSSVSFLSPQEISALGLEKEAQRESQLHQAMQLLALTHTSDWLDFVTVDLRHGEPVQKHPMMIRFEKQITNLNDFIEYPEFEQSDLKEIQAVENNTHALEYNLRRADLVKFPEHISHTSMDLLIQHPFDYVMQDIAQINGSSVPAMADVKRTKGNVAHAVIEALFKPEEDKTTDPRTVKAELDSIFDDVFTAQIEAYGAILNLRENLLEMRQLKAELRHCIDNLIDIMIDNDLKVTGCEHKVMEKMRLISGDEDPMVHGIIDMTLVDSALNPVVFDFKWTGSKKYYQGLLQDNISSQLEMYKFLLQEEKRQEVKRCAYFLMPEGNLYSRCKFSGDHCEQVSSEDYSDLMGKIRASYRYRRDQITAGKVFNEDGARLAAFEYGRDTEAKGLFPLHTDPDGCKTGNIFTNYQVFKSNN